MDSEINANVESLGSFPQSGLATEEVNESTQKGAAGGSYRAWSHEEEKVLIEGMKKAKLAGLKSPQGFKPGGFQYLQVHMRKHFPNTDLRIKPHIKNRVRSMRDKHKAVLELSEKSGMGWCDIKKEFSCSDEIWRAACQKHKVLNKIKRERFVFFEDWCEIYGTERARGEGARGYEEERDKLLVSDDEYFSDEMEGNGETGEESLNAEGSGGPSSGQKRPIPDEVESNRNIKRAKRGKLGHRGNNDSSPFFNMMNGLGNILKEAVQSMKGPIIVSNAAGPMSKAEKVQVMRSHMDSFYALPPRARYCMSKKLLADDELLDKFNAMEYSEMEEWVMNEVQTCGEIWGANLGTP